jgi:hypothetical protein
MSGWTCIDLQHGDSVRKTTIDVSSVVSCCHTGILILSVGSDVYIYTY